jgi:LysM repeat protein
MKKLFFAGAAALAAIIVVSCATKGAEPGDFSSQQEVDAAFEKVYGAYADALIMEGAKEYTVVKGDSLTKISGRNYQGAMFYFPLLMLASKDIAISDPDLIEPGMKLMVPDLTRNLDNPDSKKKIKSYLEDIARIYDKKGGDKAEFTAEHLRELAGTL